MARAEEVVLTGMARAAEPTPQRVPVQFPPLGLGLANAWVGRNYVVWEAWLDVAADIAARIHEAAVTAVDRLLGGGRRLAPQYTKVHRLSLKQPDVSRAAQLLAEDQLSDE
jgi:hypothetical protein